MRKEKMITNKELGALKRTKNVLIIETEKFENGLNRVVYEVIE